MIIKIIICEMLNVQHWNLFHRWSCWSEFSQCSVTCGEGRKHRARHCEVDYTRKGHHGGMLPQCEGQNIQSVNCSNDPCISVPGTIEIFPFSINYFDLHIFSHFYVNNHP